MRLVSPLLKHAVYPALHYAGYLERLAPADGFAVVNYHGVVPNDHSDLDLFLDGNLVTSAGLRRQLRFLKTHYRVIHPEDFRAWLQHGKSLPPRAVLVTCDDGLLNTLTEMLPILQSESIPCIFFVTGASATDVPTMLWYEELYFLMREKPLSEDLQLPDEPNSKAYSHETFQARWWRTVRKASQLDAHTRAQWLDRVRRYCDLKQPPRSEKRSRLLNRAELRQLLQAGMTIGAHTLTHPVLSLCSENEAQQEIHQSKLDLERVLDRPIWAFAYPYGNPATMGEREIRLARDSHFDCGFINVEHWSYGPSNFFAIPRIHVTLRTTIPEFAAHLSGLHLRLQRAIAG